MSKSNPIRFKWNQTTKVSVIHDPDFLNLGLDRFRVTAIKDNRIHCHFNYYVPTEDYFTSETGLWFVYDFYFRKEMNRRMLQL